jgi:hypothetical protein
VAAGKSAPTSVAEALNTIAMNISAAMTCSDAGPHMAFLDSMQKAVIGQIHKGAGGPQGGPPQGQPPAGPPGLQGGGTNIGQIMGGGAQPPATAGGPPTGSPSGVSADDMRRVMAQQSAGSEG